jgi:hypothetical protein
MGIKYVHNTTKIILEDSRKLHIKILFDLMLKGNAQANIKNAELTTAATQFAILTETLIKMEATVL